MRVATFNVDGINGRLPVRCAGRPKPQSRGRIRRDLARQESWNGVAILARGAEPIETCRVIVALALE
jgi:exonuclease III